MRASSSSHRDMHTHTPDLRFTLNTEKTAGLSSPLAELLSPSRSPSLTSPWPLPCYRSCLSHSDYCFLVFSSREWAEQQSDKLPSRLVCSHSSSANRVHSLTPSFLFFASFHQCHLFLFICVLPLSISTLLTSARLFSPSLQSSICVPFLSL